jgi:phosphoribosylformylglycinamidine synthase subunit PurS
MDGDEMSSGGANRWLAEVFVSLKPAVNDPQGLAIRDGLHMLGYGEVEDVRAGKYLRLVVSAADEPSAARRVEEMCERLLANTVIESYRFELSEQPAPQAVGRE